MTFMTSRRRVLALGLGSLAAPALRAQKSWPVKAITFISSTGAGSQADVMCRLVSAGMSTRLGVPIVMENKPGALGTLAAGILANAPADGYSIGLTNNGTLPAVPYMFKHVPYDPIKSFAHIGQFGGVPWVLVVPAQSPFKSVADMVRYGQSGGAQLTTGYVSNSARFAAHMLIQRGKVPALQVPYKTTAQAYLDMRGGQLDFTFLTADFALNQERAGALRILAVTTPARWSLMPNVATLAESFPGVSMVSWMALSAPAGTPNDVVTALAGALEATMATQDVKDKFQSLGTQAFFKGPQETTAVILAEMPAWRTFVQEARVELE